MHDPEKLIKLGTDTSAKKIKIIMFQQKKPLNYYSRKLTPTETNYTTKNKKNVCNGGNIEIVTTFDAKNKTQNIDAHGPQKIVNFF